MDAADSTGAGNASVDGAIGLSELTTVLCDCVSQWDTLEGSFGKTCDMTSGVIPALSNTNPAGERLPALRQGLQAILME
jgi:hypothetical protein